MSGLAREELELFECELQAHAARTSSERRVELLARALQGYQGFVELHSGSEVRERAEALRIGLAGEYARALAARLEELSPEDRARLREELASSLGDAVARASALIASLRARPREERSRAHSERLHELMLTKGALLLELAATAQDPLDRRQQSREAYRELVDEAGATSPAGLRAMAGIGDAAAAQGELSAAAQAYGFVVAQAIPREPGAWRQARTRMSPRELDQRFLFVELATAGLVDALRRTGDQAQATAYCLHFLNTWQREGLELDPPLGHLSLLAVARGLSDAGGFVSGAGSRGELAWVATEEELGTRAGQPALDLALDLARTVDAQNQGNELQLLARGLIGELLARPGAPVDPRILFEVAQGDYYAGDLAGAIAAFKRVLASLEQSDREGRVAIGSRALWHLGRCYQNEGRLLEAALTFRRALERFGGDPEFDRKNAQGLYDTLQELQRALGPDGLIDDLVRSCEELASPHDERARADGACRRADAAYQEGRFEEARLLFAQVPAEAGCYEKARVFAAVCAYRLGRLDEAARSFAEYLDWLAEQPGPPPGGAPGIARRREAEATAILYRGLTASQRAERGEVAWEEVIGLLAGFEQRFPEQSAFAAAALYRLMLAHDRLEQRDEAQRVYERMLALCPDDRWTGMAAAESYRTLERRRAAEPDRQAQRSLLRGMAERLRVANRTAAAPAFNNLRTEAKHWMDLGEYATAQELLAGMLETFGQAGEGQDLERLVLPELGQALLHLGRPRECAQVLRAQVEGGRATRKTAQCYARALAGWVDYVEPAEGGQGEIVLLAGLGDPPSLAKAAEIFRQLEGSAEEWSSEWLDCRFDLLYASLVGSELDGKPLQSLQRALEFVGRANLGPSFEHGRMPEGLRQKYLWLQARTR